MHQEPKLSRFGISEFDKLQDTLRGFSQKERALRRCWVRLLYDLVAIACNLRSAVLLDYIGKLPRNVIESLVTRINLDCYRWCVVFHPEAWFLCNPMEKREDLCSRSIVLIDFTNGIAPRLLPAHESDAFLEMQTRLSRFLEKAYSNKESFVDLEALEGSLSMVTLTGLLLGYPVIYCMSKERLNHACEELKKAELMLVEVSLRCKFVGSQNQLLSFSIPLSFIRHGNVAMDAIHGMEERFNAILGDHQELWEKLTVRIHHAPAHSVAL